MRGVCLILANAIVLIGFSQLDQSQQKYRDTIQHETSFIENKGQVDGDSTLDILCHFQFQQLTGFVQKGGGISFQFQHNQNEEGEELNKYFKNRKHLPQLAIQQTHRVDMELLHANPSPTIRFEDFSGSYSNYYTKNALQARHFGRIVFENVYPKIDWVLYFSEGQFKYDFIVKPGGNPEDIKMAYYHFDSISLTKDGDLCVNTRLGSFFDEHPQSYQDNRQISTDFYLNKHIVGFSLSSFDTNDTLIIDPMVRVWATYCGGAGIDLAMDTKVDAANNIYIAGYTSSTTNIAAQGFSLVYGGGNYDAFLVKYNSNGSRLWGTYYGGTNQDVGYALATDASLNVYLVGETSSMSQIANNGFQNVYGGIADAFVVKFNSAGTRLWATYYGGNDYDIGLSVDCSNNQVVLAGLTSSTGLASSGFQNWYGGNDDAFVVKFDASGNRIWCSYYGGDEYDQAFAVKLDASSNVFVAGSTASSISISSSGHQMNYGGNYDGFLVKFNSNGSRLWGTYYGGNASDDGYELSVDNLGNSYLAGQTFSSNNIASGGHQNVLAGANDVFLVKFSPSGLRLWGTYYGGSIGNYFGQDEEGTFPACAVDAQNNVYLGGSTASTNNISLNGYQNALSGNTDGFIVKFNSSGLRQWATYYGGGSSDYLYGLAVNSTGAVYAVGTTGSNFGTQIASNGHQNTYGGGNLDAFLVKLAVCSNTQASVSVTSCGSYTYNGVSYANSGVYNQTLQNVAGCDSLVTLTLNVINASSSNLTVQACNSYSLNGQTYNTTGTYQQQLVNSVGCDSIITLNLTIFQPTSATLQATACGSYTLNGATYTASGMYQQWLTNMHGCDSILTLNLTLLNSPETNLYYSTCSSVTVNGQNYQTSGVYLQAMQNVQGCDSNVWIHVTILPSYNLWQTVLACSTYTWVNGVTYTASTNQPSVMLYTTYGCDSLVHLNLILGTSDSVTTSATGFGNYTWNGSTYDQSGTYVQVLSNQYGCDSVVTLNLIIEPAALDETSNASLLVFPNPSHDGLFELQSSKNIEIMEVLDVSGRAVPFQVNGTQLLLNQNSGVYLCVLRYGNSMEVIRLVITP
jgi:hypothetical protein